MVRISPTTHSHPRTPVAGGRAAERAREDLRHPRAVAALAGLYLNAFHADEGEDYMSGGYPPSLFILIALVLPCGVAAVITGVPAIRRSEEQGRGGMALAGVGSGLLAIVLSLVTIWSILTGAWGPD
jgi:uncharacterized membrane protein HdeD (DUF308 family)